MYVIDFAKRLFHKGNTGVIIYLVLNIGLYITIFGGFTDGGRAAAALMVYLVTLCIALSPVGEFLMRMQNGCRKIKRRDHLERLMPLWEEVYAQAKIKDPSISDNVRLFMSPSDVPNAFATGRKTICITKGFMSYSDAQIKGTLAHEFAHLAYKDTDLLLLIAVGNMLMSIIFILFRIVVNIFILIFAVGLRMGFIGTFLTSLFINGLLTFLMWIWTKIGMLLCMHSSRQNEYRADKFAYELGYGNDLAVVLDSFSTGDTAESKSLWAQLRSTHPDTDDRIAKLQEYGSTYSNMYGHDLRAINENPEAYGYEHEIAPVLPGRGGYQQPAPGSRAPTPLGAAAIAPSPQAAPPQQPVYTPPPQASTPIPAPSYAPAAQPRILNHGDAVFALWKHDGFYYAGHIHHIEGHKINVLFLDAETETVNIKDIVSTNTAFYSMTLEGNWENQGAFYPCQVQSSSGDMHTVRYIQDGVVETIPLSQLRASNPPAHADFAIAAVAAPVAAIPTGAFCGKCGANLIGSGKFCPKCGEPAAIAAAPPVAVPVAPATQTVTERVCTGCSAALSATAKFCKNCGLPSALINPN